MRRLPLLMLLLSVLGACAGRGGPASAPTRGEHEAGKEIVWVRDAAEYRVAALQAYRVAGRQLEELAAGREAGTWAVILDADETVISNLDYSLARAAIGHGWSEDSWEAWVRSERATAMPGAIAFIDRVRELGGRVAIVTNRRAATCDFTRRNLIAVGVPFDHLRCKDAESDKSARWEEVRTGEGTGLGPLEIVMWVGDNIHDFPGMDQSVRTAPVEELADFGRRFILLPNPLYGSWEER